MNSMSTVPPVPRFRFRSRGGLLHADPHAADFFGTGRLPGVADDHAADDVHGALAGPRASRRSGRALHERLAFPQLARALGEVALEFVQRHGQRAALAGGPQPRIEFVQPAVRAHVGGDLDDPLAQLAEEMLVASWRRSRRPRCACSVWPSAS